MAGHRKGFKFCDIKCKIVGNFAFFYFYLWEMFCSNIIKIVYLINNNNNFRPSANINIINVNMTVKKTISLWTFWMFI